MQVRVKSQFFTRWQRNTMIALGVMVIWAAIDSVVGVHHASYSTIALAAWLGANWASMA